MEFVFRLLKVWQNLNQHLLNPMEQLLLPTLPFWQVYFGIIYLTN